MKKILAIDDQQDNLTTYKAVLKSNFPDCKLFTALSGKEGIEIAKNEQPDTILLDIIMPDMNGYETCEKLKANKLTQHIPVIMITAIKTDSKSRVKGLELGADAFLSKPIDTSEFSAQVKVMLRIKEAEDQLRAEKEELKEVVIVKTDKLKESEEKYKALYENAPLPYQSLDEDGKIIDVNTEWLELLGYEKNEVIGQWYGDFLDTDSKTVFRNNFSTLKKCGVVQDVPFKIRSKNGHFIEIALNGSSGYNPDGSFKQTYCVFQDITDRKIAERALIKSENQFRLIAENTSDNIAITTFDLKAQYTYVSPSLKSVFGYDPEDLIGKSFFDFVHPKDKKTLFPLLKEYVSLKVKNLLTGSKLPISKTIEYRFKDKTGDWIILQSTINIAGKNLLAVSRDITKNKQIEKKLKKSEEDYRGLFENAHDAILIFSHEDETVLDVNQRACDIYGFSRKEFLGKSLLDISKHPSKGKKHIQRTIKDGFFNEFESIQYKKDGSLIHLEINASIIQFKGQQAILSINRDITDRKKTENELLKNQYYLNKAQELGSIGTWELDLEQNTLTWTEENYKIFGIPLGTKMNYELFLDCVHPDDRNLVNESWNVGIKNKQYDIEHRLIVDGEVKWVREKAEFEFDKKRNPIKAIGFTQDIHKRKMADRQILLSENRYRELVDTINSGVAVYKVINDGDSGSDYIIQDFNKLALEIEGMTKEQVVGKSLKDIRPTIDEYGLIPVFKKVWKSGEATFYPAKEYKDNKYTNYYENRVFQIPSGEIVAIYDDVTERENAILEIKESQERFDLSVNATEDGIYDWNLLNNDIYYTPSWKSMLGYTDEELPNDFSTWENLTDPDDAKKSWEMVNQLINKKRDRFEIEFKMKHKDGHWVDILSRAKAIFDESGKAVRIIGTHVNISERKRSEERLQNITQRLQLSTESAGIGIWDLDIKNNILSWDQQMFQLYGIKEDDFGGAYETWKAGVHPDDIEKSDADVQEAINNKKDFHSIFRVVWPSGEIRHIEAHATVQADINGIPERMTGVNWDITELKNAEEVLQRSEERYQDFIRHSREGIYRLEIKKPIDITLDVESQIDLINEYAYYAECNEAFLKMYQTSTNEILNQRLSDFHDNNNKASSRKNIQNFIKSGYKLFNAESHEAEKNGIDSWFSNQTIGVIEDGLLTRIWGTQLDITDRKSYEAKLKEQAVFVQQNPAPVFRASNDGFILLANESTLNISPKLKSGNSVFDLLTSLTKQTLNNLKSNIPAYLEQSIGNKTYLFAITKDTDTDSVYFFGSDITARKKAELASKESAEKYKTIYETTKDAIFLTKDMILKSCNSKTLELFECKEDDIVGKTQNDFSPKFQEDGMLSADKALKYFEKTLKGKPQNFEWKHLKKGGSTFDAEVSLSKMILPDGEYVHAIVRDISNRKRAELIQKTLYNISNAVLTTDSLKSFVEIISKEMGKIIDTTNFFIAFYDQKTDTFSSPFLSDEIDNYDTWPAGKTFSSYVVKTSKSLFLTKERIFKMRDEGKIEIVGAIPEAGMIVPLIYEGVTTGVFAIQNYTDKNAYTIEDLEMLDFVSDQISLSIHRKKMDQDLKAALEQAKESDRLKSVFLATMSHELRTPLNAIIGFSDIIDIDVPVEEILEYNKTINTSGTHLLSIVEDLFDITLIETGEIKIINNSFDLNQILREIQEVIRIEQHNTSKENIDIELLAPNIDEELILVSDAHKLKQILINLLKNALKFTHQGNINYGYKLTQNGGVKMMEFFVSDTGIGIKKDQFQFIFDAFRQVEDAHTRAYGGTGIGLSISRKLVGLLGGEMWLESKEGVGSKFYFTIPAIIESKQSVLNPVLPEIKNKPKAKIVLIAEDDKASYEYLNVILRAQNINTIWAKDGKEAVDICKENPKIDLVLMDINMPIMNGFEATHKIKELNPNLPIVAQTAYAIAGDKQKSLDAGCDDYISKPIKKDGIIRLLKEYL